MPDALPNMAQNPRIVDRVETMVVVAQRLERPAVARKVAGSTPVSHPKFFLFHFRPAG